MQVRRMTVTDIEVVHNLVNTFGRQREELSFFTSHPYCYPLVAETDGRLVGTAVASQHGSVGWVGKVFVASDVRGKGIGTALTKALTDELEAQGCSTIALVATDMARRMYEALGFRVQGSYHAFKGPAAEMPVHPRLRPLRREDLED